MTLNYEQAVEFIHGIARFGPKPGLRRIRLLLERMGNPQKGLKFVHVAGTNGKGSTCTMLSYALARAGYKTGLYISPFVLDFCERVQINNCMIPREELAKSTATVKAHWDVMDAQGEAPSEFETLVAVALDYFTRMKVDIVVLEVGMGGRIDATNIIDTPLVSVITSLGMDHMEYLGNTIDKIAFEKCGIIKPGGVTVCYPWQEPEAMEVVRRRAQEEGNPLILPVQPETLAMDFFGTRIRYGGMELTLPLIGEHQVKNASVALEVLKVLAGKGFAVSDEDIVRGIADVSFPARLEVIRCTPLVVLDGAHNYGGAQVLAHALKMLSGRRIHAVMGMLSNKDVTGVLSEILPLCETFTAVPVTSNPAALPPEKLAELGGAFCENVSVADNARAGVRAVFARCGKDDVLLVCGSLYLASELRGELVEL